MAKCSDLGTKPRHWLGCLYHRHARHYFKLSRRSISLGPPCDLGRCFNRIRLWVIFMDSIYLWGFHGYLGDGTLVPKKPTCSVLRNPGSRNPGADCRLSVPGRYPKIGWKV